MTSGSYNASRLIVRGREDLGGGMAASFWLEGQLTDDGQGVATNTNNQPATGTPAAAGTQGFMFNRRSYVGLTTPMGELRLGRDFLPQYWNRTLFDALGASGVGATIVHNRGIVGVTTIRASNTIGYLLPPKLGGVYGQATYYLGENLSNAGATRDDGSGYGVRLGYASGPFNVAVATGRTRYAAGNARQSNIGGHWDFGMVKIMGHIEHQSLGARDAKGWHLGGAVPVGRVGEIRLGYSTMAVEPAAGVGAKATTSKVALRYIHNLSKRTAVYATVATVRNKNGANYALGSALTGPNRGSNGADFGIRHSF